MEPELDALRSSSRENGAEDAAKKVQEEQMRRDLLATVLDTAARERRR